MTRILESNHILFQIERLLTYVIVPPYKGRCIYLKLSYIFSTFSHATNFVWPSHPIDRAHIVFVCLVLTNYS